LGFLLWVERALFQLYRFRTPGVPTHNGAG
jgi:hypothetical protein